MNRVTFKEGCFYKVIKDLPAAHGTGDSSINATQPELKAGQILEFVQGAATKGVPEYLMIFEDAKRRYNIEEPPSVLENYLKEVFPPFDDIFFVSSTLLEKTKSERGRPKWESFFKKGSKYRVLKDLPDPNETKDPRIFQQFQEFFRETDFYSKKIPPNSLIQCPKPIVAGEIVELLNLYEDYDGYRTHFRFTSNPISYIGDDGLEMYNEPNFWIYQHLPEPIWENYFEEIK